MIRAVASVTALFLSYLHLTNLITYIFNTMKHLYLIFFITLFATSTNAQVQLSVDSYGDYEASLAAFGINDPCNFPPIEADLVLIDDGTENRLGCVPYNDPRIEGNIAVVQRGTCDFWEKTIQAQNNDAVAVVICNTDPALRHMADHPDAEGIDIPSILITSMACELLMTDLENGEALPASIQPDFPQLSPNVSIVWGDQAGQGEFDGGLNGWRVEDCTIENEGNTVEELSWFWTDLAIEDWFGVQMNSYSRCNGVAGYDATQWNIDNGNLDNPNNYPNHSCSLISPVIDLSNAGGDLNLQFWQIAISLNGNNNPGDPVTRFFVSTDGGQTFGMPTYVSGSNPQNDALSSQLERYFMPELAGEDEVVLKFEFFGDFYAWYIDDVYFTSNISPKFNTQFYPYPTNAMTPCYLTENLTGIAESFYINDSSDYNMEINLEGPERFDFELEVEDTNGDAKYCGTNTIRPEAPGQYAIDMYMTENGAPVDSSRFRVQKNFRITDLVWSKDPGMVNELIRPAADSGWVWGSVFTVPENYSGSEFILGAEFGFELVDSIDSRQQFVSFEMLEWTDTNDDDRVQLDERSSLGGGFVEFSYRDGIDGEMNSYNFNNLQNIDPIPLEAGKHYILAVTWQNDNRKLNMMGYTGLNYDGMQYMYRECLGKDRYVDVIGVGQSSINGTWSTAGWSSKTVPAMRLVLNRRSCVVNNGEIGATKNPSLKLSPNPASDRIAISLGESFTENVQAVSIYDLSGQLKQRTVFEGTQSLPISLDIGQWQQGVYLVQLQTESGLRIGKFVVQR
ncbi:MAG TPA: PA domain-containing protein [Saprospiraceae bacterium]|nr:PA domain-containing protein [Saprospiraceae bacterium]